MNKANTCSFFSSDSPPISVRLSLHVFRNLSNIRQPLSQISLIHKHECPVTPRRTGEYAVPRRDGI